MFCRLFLDFVLSEFLEEADARDIPPVSRTRRNTTAVARFPFTSSAMICRRCTPGESSCPAPSIFVPAYNTPCAHFVIAVERQAIARFAIHAVKSPQAATAHVKVIGEFSVAGYVVSKQATGFFEIFLRHL